MLVRGTVMQTAFRLLLSGTMLALLMVPATGRVRISAGSPILEVALHERGEALIFEWRLGSEPLLEGS